MANRGYRKRLVSGVVSFRWFGKLSGEYGVVAREGASLDSALVGGGCRRATVGQRPRRCGEKLFQCTGARVVRGVGEACKHRRCTTKG